MRKHRSRWTGGLATLIAAVACGGNTTGTASVRDRVPDASVGAGGTRALGSGGSSGAPPDASVTSPERPPQCPLPAPCNPITCGPGESPVTLPEECCPSLCKPAAGGSGGAGGAPSTGPEIDAGTCAITPMPSCGGNAWPHCASTWTEAVSDYPTCPEPQIGAYLASCGGMHAIVVPGPYVERRFFYDSADRVVGFESVSGGSAHCDAYLGGFQAPAEGCVPLAAPCFDAGTSPAATLNGIDAGGFVDWGDVPPDCATGQAAYDAYLQAQLAEFDTCTQDFECNSLPGLPNLDNPCVEPCGLVLSATATNAQVAFHLDTFGRVACARCAAGPAPACPPRGYFGKCVSGHCSQ